MTNKKTSSKASQKGSSGYFVATFERFPGIKIPMLSEAECRARGIEPDKLPPLGSWSPEQQAALHELAELIVQLAVEELVGSAEPIAGHPGDRKGELKFR